MNVSEGTEKFIQSWGAFATSWGINRTMAQIHALLLTSPSPLTADDIMELLQMSRGNVNLNLRALMDWGLVMKELRPGERKDYFVAEKDIWEVVRRIIIERKKRELEPMLKVLDELTDIQGEDEATQQFIKMVKDIRLFSTKADATLDALVKSDSNWFIGTFMKMIK
jgi:DNA-binding transcriptional regulator GbsR (MarR family)